MAGANVVGGERQPGAIRFFNVIWQQFLQHVDVTGASQNAFTRVKPVANLQAVRRFFGQHHDAANAGVTGGVRVPV
jgi:hypothetical protein